MRSHDAYIEHHLAFFYIHSLYSLSYYYRNCTDICVIYLYFMIKRYTDPRSNPGCFDGVLVKSASDWAMRALEHLITHLNLFISIICNFDHEEIIKTKWIIKRLRITKKKIKPQMITWAMSAKWNKQLAFMESSRRCLICSFEEIANVGTKCTVLVALL